MGKIQDSIMKDVTEFIETRVEQVCASQIISDDDSLPFTNLSRVRINEMVENVIFRFLITLIF